jgi:hypothetical protein
MTPPAAEGKLNETKFAVKPEVEAKPRMSTFEKPEAGVADQETESLTVPTVVEVMAEEEPAMSSLDQQLDTNNLIEFVEEEVLHIHLEETGMGPDEPHEFPAPPTYEFVEDCLETGDETSIFQVGDESNAAEQAITSPEQPIRINLSVEEVEDPLHQLTERMQASEPETIEKVNEILDKIIEVPAKLEESNGESIVTEAEAQEELEELFTELFDRMAIDYTPELIESLAHLTLEWHLVDEIEKLKNEDEADEVPAGSGIHKIIQKLLAGLSKIKRAMAHAYAIGKSALQLYAFNFAT